MSTEYNVTLGRITQELESSIKTDSLSYAPTLAVTNLPNFGTHPESILDIQLAEEDAAVSLRCHC